MTRFNEQQLASLDADTFDPEVFRQTGVFVVRRAIPAAVMRAWQEAWDAFYESTLRGRRAVNQANPVALMEALPPLLANMYREPAFAAILKPLFGEHIAIYHHRFVIKDEFSTGKVKLHQDSCYHLGNLNKCSIFTPLSQANPDNGAMTFHVGSHKLGVLGDAGEIDPGAFDIRWPTITPRLEPGDVVVMNSSLWHESGLNTSGVHRIMADTLFQPADDPTGRELVCGDWQTDLRYSTDNHIRFFVNSRIHRLIRCEKERAAAQAAGE